MNHPAKVAVLAHIETVLAEPMDTQQPDVRTAIGVVAWYADERLRMDAFQTVGLDQDLIGATVFSVIRRMQHATFHRLLCALAVQRSPESVTVFLDAADGSWEVLTRRRWLGNDSDRTWATQAMSTPPPTRLVVPREPVAY